MAIKDKLTEEFLIAIHDIEIVLLSLLFKKHSFFEKGLAYYIEYKKGKNTKVKFLFGPPEWHIDIVIHTSKGDFEFKDLLNVTEINRWVNDNRYKQENGRNIKNELLWFVELLKVSLPFAE
jgi:hypothetical protein